MKNNLEFMINENIYVKYYLKNNKDKEQTYILVVKWDSNIKFWTAIIGHKDIYKLNKLKQIYNLSNYNLDDLNDLDEKIKFVCFDTLQNLDRNISPDGEDGWCCYQDKKMAENICSKVNILQKLEEMI